MKYSKTVINVILISLLLGFTITTISYLSVTSIRGPMNWDEGDYYRWTHRIATTIKSTDFSDFWTQTHKQRVHPFLFSWLMAPFTLLPSVSLTTLLLGNHLVLAIFPLIVVGILSLICPRLSPWESLCFALVFATAPVSLEYVSVFMPEFIGVIMLFAALGLWGTALTRDRPGLATLAGVILPVVFFLKFSFGIILILAILCHFAERIVCKDRPSRSLVVRLFLPFTVLSLIWFLTPFTSKVRGFMAFIVNRSATDSTSVLTSLKTYLIVVTDMLTASPLLWVVFPAGAILAVVAAVSDRKARFYVVASAVTLVTFSFHSYTVSRLAIHIVPTVWILTVVGYEWLSFNRKLHRLRPLLIACLVIVSVASVAANNRFFRQEMPGIVNGESSATQTTNWWVQPDIQPVLDRIAESVCGAEKAVWIVGETNDLNPGAIEFAIANHCPDAALSLIHDAVYPGPALRWQRQKISNGQVRQIIDSVIVEHSPDVLILIDIEPGSRQDTDDYQRWHQWKRQILSRLHREKRYKDVSTTRFTPGGITMEVRKRTRFIPLQLHSKKNSEVDL